GWSNPTWGPHRNLSPPDTQNAPCGALRVSGGERGIHSPLRASPFGRWLRHRATRCAGGRTPLGVLIATSLRQIRKTPLAGRFAYLAERGGFTRRCAPRPSGGGYATVPPAARVVEPHLGSSSQPLSARYAKRPLRGASRIWRREGDSNPRSAV